MAEAYDRTTGGAHTRRPFVVAALVLAAALVLPATASAGPAIDEYTLDLPDAKGNVESPEASPVANPAALPPGVASRLTRNPSGKALATIATASSLGAPVEDEGGKHTVGGGKSTVAGGDPAVAGAEPSTLTAVGNAASDPAAIGLIAVLLAIVGGMFLIRRRA